MGEIRIMNRRGNKNRFPSNTTIQSTETANTTQTLPETPSTPIQIQEDIKMMTKMTYDEIKNALAAGKVFSRVGKNKSRTEVRMFKNEPVRRYIYENGDSTEWAATSLNTMPKFEWEVSDMEELPPEELKAPVIKQVQLGDGTSTVVTEYVPISEAPVVIDPFAIPLDKDNDTPEPEPEPTPEPEPVPETDNMPNPEPEAEEPEEAAKFNTATDIPGCLYYSKELFDAQRMIYILMNPERNLYAVDINNPFCIYRYNFKHKRFERGNHWFPDDNWETTVDINRLLNTEFRLLSCPLDWKEAVDEIRGCNGRTAVCVSTGTKIVNRRMKICFDDGLTREDMDCYWTVY